MAPPPNSGDAAAATAADMASGSQQGGGGGLLEFHIGVFKELGAADLSVRREAGAEMLVRAEGSSGGV